jgi:arylsulfatase A-like enzyme
VTRRRWGVALAPLLAFTAGCPGPQKAVVYDLVERLPVAELWSAREVLLFGTPASEPHQAEGFYREAAQGAADSFLWAREEAEISLTWPTIAARGALVDLAPYRGIPSQSVVVSLNGIRVAAFGVNGIRQRYRIDLPAAAQRVGDNRLRFVFARSARPSDADPKNQDQRHLAAAFYSLTVGRATDPSLEDLLSRDAPTPFAVVRSTGPPSLVEVGPSIVTYAVRLPEGAELRFKPELHKAARAAAGQAAFRVTLEDAPGRPREIWSRVIAGNDPRPGEVSLPLEGTPGSIVRIGLGVGSAEGGRFAWGVFGAPRLLGLRAEGRPEAPRPAASGGAGTEALRRGLAGMNVLFVILDAARAQEFSCYGYHRETTPEIDRIAREGVLFEDAATPAVYTLGAMSSVWTSQYPDRHHSEVSFSDRLPADRVTLVNDVLTPRNVWTAGFVANAVAGKAFGFDRGFNAFVEVFREYGSGAGGFRNVVPGTLEVHKAQRMFTYVHFREPHFPYDPPPPFDTRFGPDGPIPKGARGDMKWITDVNQGRRTLSPAEREHLTRLYDGNLAFADQEVGALRKSLELMGLWDKTVVVIAADHGEELLEHGWIGHNVHLYEESVHVPLIIRFPPGRGPAGTRIKGLVSLLDLAPTVADIFGFLGAGGSGAAFQGRTLLPRLAGEDGPETALLTRTVWDRPRYALRDGRYKLFYDTRTGERELFDLERDPGETHDLKEAEPLRAAYEQEALHAWIATLSTRISGEGHGPAAPLTREQCEDLKTLGYLDPNVRCPER